MARRPPPPKPAPKKPANHGKQWSSDEVKRLKELADGNTPTRVIALKMKRTEDSIRSKAADEEVSLKPTNQAPYGTQS